MLQVIIIYLMIGAYVSFFCVLFPDVAPFIEFLKSIQDGTIVLMGTYDDGATKYVIDLCS